MESDESNFTQSVFVCDLHLRFLRASWLATCDHIEFDTASYGVFLLESLLIPEQQRADLIQGGCVNS